MQYPNRNYQKLWSGAWVGRTSKVGQTSLQSALNGETELFSKGPRDAEQDPANPDIICFVRNPHERLISCWRDMNGRRNWVHPIRGLEGENAHLEWEYFINRYILSDETPKNHHYDLQANLHRGEKTSFVPNIVWRFDDFSVILREIWGVNAQIQNPSKTPPPVDPLYRARELMRLYAEDWDHYLSASPWEAKP